VLDLKQFIKDVFNEAPLTQDPLTVLSRMEDAKQWHLLMDCPPSPSELVYPLGSLKPLQYRLIDPENSRSCNNMVAASGVALWFDDNLAVESDDKGRILLPVLPETGTIVRLQRDSHPFLDSIYGQEASAEVTDTFEGLTWSIPPLRPRLLMHSKPVDDAVLKFKQRGSLRLLRTSDIQPLRYRFFYGPCPSGWARVRNTSVWISQGEEYHIEKGEIHPSPLQNFSGTRCIEGFHGKWLCAREEAARLSLKASLAASGPVMSWNLCIEQVLDRPADYASIPDEFKFEFERVNQFEEYTIQQKTSEMYLYARIGPDNLGSFGVRHLCSGDFQDDILWRIEPISEASLKDPALGPGFFLKNVGCKKRLNLRGDESQSEGVDADGIHQIAACCRLPWAGDVRKDVVVPKVVHVQRACDPSRPELDMFWSTHGTATFNFDKQEINYNDGRALTLLPPPQQFEVLIYPKLLHPLARLFQKLPFDEAGLEQNVVRVQVCLLVDMSACLEETMERCSDIMHGLKMTSHDTKIVEVEMCAVCYSDWLTDNSDLGNPFEVLKVFDPAQKDIALVQPSERPPCSGATLPWQGISTSITHDNFLNLGGGFTQQLTELQAWLAEQWRGHRGKPASVELTGALLVASQLPWSADNRFVVALAEAPCHGRLYRDASVCGAGWDANTTDGLSVSDEPTSALNRLISGGVTMMFVQSSSSRTSKMKEEFIKFASSEGFREMIYFESLSGSLAGCNLEEWICARATDLLRHGPIEYIFFPGGVGNGDEQAPPGYQPVTDVGIQVTNQDCLQPIEWIPCVDDEKGHWGCFKTASLVSLQDPIFCKDKSLWLKRLMGKKERRLSNMVNGVRYPTTFRRSLPPQGIPNNGWHLQLHPLPHVRSSTNLLSMPLLPKKPSFSRMKSY
jgi:hypothetical protein